MNHYFEKKIERKNEIRKIENFFVKRIFQVRFEVFEIFEEFDFPRFFLRGLFLLIFILFSSKNRLR